MGIRTNLATSLSIRKETISNFPKSKNKLKNSTMKVFGYLAFLGLAQAGWLCSITNFFNSIKNTIANRAPAIVYNGQCPNIKGSSGFDLPTYMGRWYDHAHIPSSFQPTGDSCVTADYQLTDDSSRV